jgi:thymidylate kinase
MLITVSGVVGSGKSTAADYIASLVEREGIPGRVLRFQWLPCFTWFRSANAPTSPSGNAEIVPQRVGYRRRTLTARATLGYIARMVAFRVFRWTSARNTCSVCDRYFYDNLVHYELRSPLEHAYARLLHACMPLPDLAILLVASPTAIHERRWEYSSEYLSSMADAYTQLSRRCQELLAVQTEHREAALRELEHVVTQHLRGDAGARRAHVVT